MVDSNSESTNELVSSWQLTRTGCGGMPAVIEAACEKANQKFLDFLTAGISNPKTREAYAGDVQQFLEWCDQKRLALADIAPVYVAIYLRVLQNPRDKGGAECSKAAAKRKLKAIRMMFDYFVACELIPLNPATSLRVQTIPQKAWRR